ncbi:thioesterase II family protein [Clostridium estertheticum]|uniref:thioesterase II family protein n=1 Tax=Clostridium estertheticum TaxID=238834 RepID=UPI001C6E0FB2|nr:thioesterase domain-containing protein [Clostridium estertheticum]MBW9154573.1 thioesterase [Clostridium estertheticum]WLC83814.1 thioesterase [Clostridium estertheticum]
MKKNKLFCIPCAGGTADAYLRWDNILHYSIELCPIELKNRGKRGNEPAYKDILEAVDDVFNKIKDLIKDNNYALFGHSMGALIVYELYYKLLENSIPVPNNIFIYGKEPPNIPYKGIKHYKLSNEELKNSIAELGGTPEEVLKDDDVYNFFAPIIRADFEITEKYIFRDKKELMACNIIVINGKEDKLSSKNLEEYKKYTIKNCYIHKISGGHFELYERPFDTVRLINKYLVK